MKVIIGIDPGLGHTGWGVIKIDNNKILKAFVRETGEKVPFFIDSNLFNSKVPSEIYTL